MPTNIRIIFILLVCVQPLINLAYLWVRCDYVKRGTMCLCYKQDIFIWVYFVGFIFGLNIVLIDICSLHASLDKYLLRGEFITVDFTNNYAHLSFQNKWRKWCIKPFW